jgi:hypothetical protein
MPMLLARPIKTSICWTLLLLRREAPDRLRLRGDSAATADRSTAPRLRSITLDLSRWDAADMWGYRDCGVLTLGEELRLEP